MNLKYFITFLVIAAVFSGCPGTQKRKGNAGLILYSAFVYKTPNSEDSEKVKVNRGEAIYIIRERTDEGNREWVRIMLSDEESGGWMRKKYVHFGPKRPITLTMKTILHVRPDDQSKPVKTLQRGTSMFILREKDGWKKVSITYDLTGWIMTDNFKEGLRK